MKKLLVLAVFAFAAGASVPAVSAFAGGCGCGSGAACCKSDDGFECANQCPLAQEANKHRAMGRESLSVSTALRATYASNVQRNLARI